MPERERNENPKGLPQGAIKQQQDFLSATTPTKVPAVSPAPVSTGPEPLMFGELGDMTDVLLGRTDRPGEDVMTAPRPPGVEKTEPGYVKLLSDPGISQETRGFLEFLARARMNAPVPTPSVQPTFDPSIND